MGQELKVNLNNFQREMLRGLTNDPGFEILGLVFQAAITRATQEMIEADPTNSALVIAKQSDARAIRNFVQWVSDTLTFEFVELDAQDEPGSEEEQIISI